MKTSLQIRALRAAGPALALGLGLAAASHSAQGATVQITLGGNNWTYSMNGLNISNFPLTTKFDVTSDGTLDSVFLYRNPGTQVALFTNPNPTGSDLIASVTLSSATSSYSEFTFADARINGGSATRGFAQGVAVNNSINNVYTVTLTRVVFDNASTFAPSFTGSETGITEWSPTSTAVPEPGTFIPAAALVMGALLRRRRSRSHRTGRSGRATA